MKRYALQPLDLSRVVRSRPYKSKSMVRTRRIERIRDEHGPLLIEDYERAFNHAVNRREQIAEVPCPLHEVVLEIELSRQAKPARLDRSKEKSRQGAVRVGPDGVQKVVLIVPDKKRDVLGRILEEYTYGELKESKANHKNPAVLTARRIEVV